MSQIDLTEKSDGALREIIKNEANYTPEVVEKAKYILKLREHNAQKVMEVLNECSNEEPINKKTENADLYVMQEMLEQLKTIKKCNVFFVCLAVISIIVTVILGITMTA